MSDHAGAAVGVDTFDVDTVGFAECVELTPSLTNAEIGRAHV